MSGAAHRGFGGLRLESANVQLEFVLGRTITTSPGVELICGSQNGHKSGFCRTPKFEKLGWAAGQGYAEWRVLGTDNGHAESTWQLEHRFSRDRLYATRRRRLQSGTLVVQGQLFEGLL